MPTKKTDYSVTLEQARRVLEVVDAGICSGKGQPIPGQMCVEAAVCFALGQPHGDDPQCVSRAVRSFKIRLNDSKWSSNEARAKGMRKLAIAQLGTRDQMDDKAFVKELTRLTIKVIVPLALREAAKMNKKHADTLEKAAMECELNPCYETVKKAKETAAAADADAYAAAAAYAAADAATAADADAYAAAAAYAAADAATAADAAASKYLSRRDEILSVMADLGIQALRKVGAAGIELMDKLITD